MSQLVRTQDGSFSMFNLQAGELYHNSAGAYTEALKLYACPCDAVERLKSHGKLRLLDACFGLGYNTLVLLAQLNAQGCRGQVEVDAVEIDCQILRQIGVVLEDERLSALKVLFGGGALQEFGTYTGRLAELDIKVNVLCSDLRRFVAGLCDRPYDLVFHDPFSPRKVPELWTLELLVKYYQALAPRQGMLLTYSCASAVRGGLKTAGFSVFQTAAVGQRNGGTAGLAVHDAQVPPAGASRLSQQQVLKLKGPGGVPYRDLAWQSCRDDILLRRAQEQASN